jgi:hypothetical protein
LIVTDTLAKQIFTSQNSTPPSSAKFVVPTKTVGVPKAIPALTDPKVGTVLYKESDTGIGFKRWAIWMDHVDTTWTVWTEWGHEAKHQARKKMSLLSQSRAQAYMQNCISAKLNRGYRRTK